MIIHDVDRAPRLVAAFDGDDETVDAGLPDFLDPAGHPFSSDLDSSVREPSKMLGDFRVVGPIAKHRLGIVESDFP